MTVAVTPGPRVPGVRSLLKRLRSTVIDKPLLVLAIVVGLTALVYALLLVRPLVLLENISQKRLDGFYIRRNKPFYQVRLLLTFLLLGGLYLGGWQATRKARGWPAWLVTIGGALVCAGILLFLTPFDAADIYDNIMHARIFSVYGGNPYTQVGKDFRGDPFFEYMAWKVNPTAYGPAWELLAAGAVGLAGDDLIANVLAFKLLPGIFWLASLGLVAAFLAQVAPQQALTGVYLLALNPTLLFSTFGNGHNDIVMVFWILLATWTLARRHYTTAILALLVGALVKYIPLLLLPAAGLVVLSEIRGSRARLRFVALTVIPGLMIAWLAYRPFWGGPEILTIERRSRLFTSSLPAVAFHLLEPGMGKDRAAHSISLVAAALTMLFSLWRGWRVHLDNDLRAFPRAAFDILTFYLLVTCLWFQQWYTIWIIGLAATLPPSGYRQRFAIFFSLAVMSKQLLIGPLLFRPNPILPQPELEIIFTLSILGLPWLYWLAAYSGRLRSKPSYINPSLDSL